MFYTIYPPSYTSKKGSSVKIRHKCHKTLYPFTEARAKNFPVLTRKKN